MTKCFSAPWGALPAVCLSFLVHLGLPPQSPGQDPAQQPDSKPLPTPVEPQVTPAQPGLELANPAVPASSAGINLTIPEEQDRTAPRTFKATAYSLRGRTATGVQTQPGVIAADPRVLPLGSVVHVRAGQYSGVYTVHDTGRLVRGNLVDVWVRSSHEARTFGRRKVKLQVLRYGPRYKATR